MRHIRFTKGNKNLSKLGGSGLELPLFIFYSYYLIINHYHLRAKIVKDPEKYEWSSYQSIGGL